MSEFRKYRRPDLDSLLGTGGQFTEGARARSAELGGVTPESVTSKIEDLASMPDFRGLEPERE